VSFLSQQACLTHSTCWRSYRLQALRYNIKYRKLCGDLGIPFFDTFGLTANASSFDGIHYTQGINLLKAELLLNLVAEMTTTAHGGED